MMIFRWFLFGPITLPKVTKWAKLPRDPLKCSNTCTNSKNILRGEIKGSWNFQIIQVSNKGPLAPKVNAISTMLVGRPGIRPTLFPEKLFNFLQEALQIIFSQVTITKPIAMSRNVASTAAILKHAPTSPPPPPTKTTLFYYNTLLTTQILNPTQVSQWLFLFCCSSTGLDNTWQVETVSIWNVKFCQKTFKSNLAIFRSSNFKLGYFGRKWPCMTWLSLVSFTWV